MDWVEKLPDDLQISLESLLDDVEHQEDIYMDAENASVGQIWTAMALMTKRIRKLEKMVSAQRKALQDTEVEVDEHLDDRLEKSLKKY
ncbi:MAG: hypothetical protein ABEJ56_01250 [Candidatus Nanohaloarchaea archaeon]